MALVYFSGAYLLNIQWSDRQVRGSPFKVNVTAQSDASKVVCTGEGLKMGIMGKEIKSVIDTRRAGPGKLILPVVTKQRVGKKRGETGAIFGVYLSSREY